MFDWPLFILQWLAVAAAALQLIVTIGVLCGLVWKLYCENEIEE